MKVGDVVLLRKEWRTTGVHYGPGVVVDISHYPEEGFVSHKVQWSDDFSFHGTEELEVISESR